jgi:hypothetical protein
MDFTMTHFDTISFLTAVRIAIKVKMSEEPLRILMTICNETFNRDCPLSNGKAEVAQPGKAMDC